MINPSVNQGTETAKLRDAVEKLWLVPEAQEHDQTLEELRGMATVKLFYRLRQKGFSKEESSNLVAHIIGIQLDPGGHRINWTLKEVNTFLFLRFLHSERHVAVA
ncbi:MAG: hypothetical protein A3A97_04770 [Candidatus Terrybacteria bacterium RIFCSPLOWO2_01_FULL_40_23]|uniref:Uncharacterized protein n=1 Tax=Candidatus Terrybacteria bacterium RIFCSPLOWO2_01_FULL_40_23 TaxID=1802366 RepID=A0A1G2PX51_9BACT|nr:MAG: hypothetical protein A3A97_04770 [Candidatus Terrybacteria bacterium RIFCSPLOWO2_01_FULL_40_23]